MTKLLCIYHADCADGFASAWAVHRRFGEDVEFVAAKYGEQHDLWKDSDQNKPTSILDRNGDVVLGLCKKCGRGEVQLEQPCGIPSVEGRDVLIVDFSYPLATLRAMAAEACSVLVLDHHKTAQTDLAELCPVPETTQPGKFDLHGTTTWDYWQHAVSTMIKTGDSQFYLAAKFDLNRSGAGLTWDCLHDAPRPRIIDLVEDRDLWRFKHDPDTRRFHAVAASHGYDLANFALWDEWYWKERSCLGPPFSGRAPYNINDWPDLLRQGEAILRYERKLVEGIVRGTRRTVRIAGYMVPVAACPGALASEAGNLLCHPPLPDSLPATGVMPGDPNGPSERWRAEYAPPFSATYYDGADGRRHFSLRSPPAGADVGAIAKKMAETFNQYTLFREEHHRAFWDHKWTGGGHARAAGFDAPIGWEGE